MKSRPVLFSTLFLALPATAQMATRTPDQAPSAPSTPGEVALLSWGDFDADGLDDALSVHADGRIALLRSTGDGSLEDVTQTTGLEAIDGVRFALWGDYDADGQVDLFLGTASGPGHLLQNQDGYFVDVSADSGLAAVGPHRTAHWVDYDGDERPDLHLLGASENVLYHGLGDGRFEPVALPAPVPAAAPGARALAAEQAGATRVSSDAADRDSGPVEIDVIVGGGERTIVPSGKTKASLGGLNCVSSLLDANGGGCLGASSAATLGMLYPLSDKLFVDENTGFVGLGTTSPTEQLNVVGGNLLVEGSSTPSIQIDNHLTSTKWAIRTDSAGNLTFRNLDLSSNFMNLAADGDFWLLHDVGIGTTTPDANLAIGEVGAVNGARMLGLGEDGGATNFFFGSGFAPFEGENYVTFSTDHSGPVEDIMTWKANGNVGIGTTTPARALDVDGDVALRDKVSIGTSSNTVTDFFVRSQFAGVDDAPALFSVNFNNQTARTEGLRLVNRNATGSVGIGLLPGGPDSVTELPQVFLGTLGGSSKNDFRVSTNNAGVMSDRIFVEGTNGNVGIGTNSPTERLDVNGNAIVDVLTIRGGADLVEGFDSSDGELEPGTVVVIDSRNAGALTTSTGAYDFKVAGVVSGANGVDAGIHLGRDTVLDGDTKVAMTGRVYVKCSAENGAIQPGDRLTTAGLAGHAMKATDGARSDGAVIGKAMSILDAGTGLVLVLVNLQ